MENDSMKQETLDDATIGEDVQVVGIASPHPDRLVRLSGMGIVPGATIQVRQRTPATVLAIGETLLALDPEITAGILIRR
jgi:Fe2+ transport system protein FeoA